jgi:hypothetical protein
MRFALAAALSATALSAWNHVGHKAVAGRAYDLLDDKARARADDLIRSHPDFAKLSEGGPSDEAGRVRFAFKAAAYWPDTIRGDTRFYDEARHDAVPTQTQPGFPDMKRRLNWHYINVAFSTDGTETLPTPMPNVLTQVKWLLPLIGGSKNPGGGDDPVYFLPWLLHLVGDIHQPLHCSTRYRRGQVNPDTGRPWSDLGGNTVNVVGAYNLHAYWDDLLGITDTEAYVEGVVKAMANHGESGADVLDPDKWVEEGFEIAREVVYSFGNEGGSKESPINFSDAYRVRARQVALERASLGARRLAAVMNQRLGR